MNTQSPLEAWRANVRPLLNSIGWYAFRAKQFADLIVTDMARIPTREKFATYTEDDLEKAKASLTEALSKIDGALTEYRNKKAA